ncbi:MAG: hypothetical protein Q9221_008306 [Calogaya cf. arnoldii]
MWHSKFVGSIYILLTYLTASTSQVDIEHVIPSGSIRRGHFTISISCFNIEPGVCCRRPVYQLTHYPIIFHHLTAFDIAAVWTQRRRGDPLPLNEEPIHDENTIAECSGSVGATGRGPGTWRWHRHDAPMMELPVSQWPTIEGGSYITVPRALPPDATTANWLEMEGMFGLVWGGGSWFASAAAESAIGRMTMTRRDVRQPWDLRSPNKGSLYAGKPPRAVHPVVTVNGTSYTYNETVDGIDVYKTDAGEILDLTAILLSPEV